ncbi:tail fiber domain-containing protein [Pantoea dispersa]
MSAGNIALTNNSATVTGTGTSFTTELKPGDFVYVTVGGAPYTLVASTVTSDTQLTLAVAYDGPTTTGLAWNAVPASLQVAITQKILNDFAQVARGRILDFQNWQKIYSSDQSVTVVRPDRTTFTGPSWGYMATQFDGKANNSDVLTKADNLNSLTDKAAARTNLGLGELATLNGPLAINKGGTGSATPFGTAANTFAQGNDSRLGTINNKTGGTLTSEAIVRKTINSVSGTLVNGGLLYQGTIVDQNGTTIRSSIFPELNNGQFSQTTISNFDSGSNTSKYWQFRSDGNAYAINGTWQNSSDKRFKSDLKVIDKALAKVKSLTGYTGKRDGSDFTGLIAQDLQAVLPEAVSVMGPYTLQSNVNGKKKGDIIPDALGVAYGDTVGLLVEAIKELSGIVDNQNSAISELQQRMKAIDGLDA